MKFSPNRVATCSSHCTVLYYILYCVIALCFSTLNISPILRLNVRLAAPARQDFSYLVPLEKTCATSDHIYKLKHGMVRLTCFPANINTVQNYHPLTRGAGCHLSDSSSIGSGRPGFGPELGTPYRLIALVVNYAEL
jgi:hypothetical protein